MKPFLILWLLLACCAAQAQENNRSLYIINGKVADSADMAGLKIKKMDVLQGARAAGIMHAGGKRIILVTLEEELFDVQGMVTNNQGQPLRRVKIKPDGGQKAVKTDRRGRFRIAALKTGSTLTVSRKGYRRETRNIFKRPDGVITVTLQKE
ncbi:hypothetical protein DLD77_07360 [Chitinophaga alhagiae]|uniref:Carboxypeptidase regulatory-like domain-containing protein n=1 Tax=Chitinophaga alhagiae TaxID=2203219 RepID=A0ABM6WC84_9BACT|nr:carboxypeptidase-like regulatory domain-containing protein [Chitinophaga alhagiae]AWO01523.1 hypothetical protein DLD77_07360 [Chitinophaga alhagiae]